MTEKFRKFGADMDLSQIGGGEAPDVVSGIKRDLEGWREVLIPIAGILRWDLPYYPAILVGSTTFLFALIWLCEISTLTTISLIGLILGIVDFGVPYFGASITGYKTWTAEEEYQFTYVCENIANFRRDTVDMWHSLISLRENNSKMFFICVMGALSFAAWLGNLVNNLFLTYIIVTVCLCWPGLQRNEITQVYLKRGASILAKLQALVVKPKEQ